LDTEDLPKFGNIEPSSIHPAIENVLQKLERDFTSLETQLTESTDVEYNTVLPVLEQKEWYIAGHLNGVKNGDELHQAYEQNQPKIIKAMSMFQQSMDEAAIHYGKCARSVSSNSAGSWGAARLTQHMNTVGEQTSPVVST
jgi:Zn-dependent oligopeptidase